MATSLSNLQARFLRKVTEYAFDSISEANRNATLYGYLESCIPKFYQCESSLSVIEPDGEVALPASAPSKTLLEPVVNS